MLDSKFADGRILPILAENNHGKTIEFSATLRIDTPQEILYYQHGGILPYVLRQLAAKGESMQRNHILLQKPDNTGCNHYFDRTPRKIDHVEVGRCAKCLNEIAIKLDESGKPTGESWIVEVRADS
jgi:hypothetical protein